MTDREITLLLIGFASGLAAVCVLWGVLWLLMPWVRAFLFRIRLDLSDLIGMRLRRTPVNLIVDALVSIKVRGHRVSRETLAAIELLYSEDRRRYKDGRVLADEYLSKIATGSENRR